MCIRSFFRLPDAIRHRNGQSAPSQSFTQINNPEAARLALQNFKNLQTYMKDRPGQGGIALLEEYLENIRNEPELLDEAFVEEKFEK